MILKDNQKQSVRGWTRFIWPKLGSSGGILWIW